MNQSIDICISFDTTGSMYPCLTQVRNKVSQMVTKLFTDLPDLRIAIIAHGDYCDEKTTYVLKKMDFTTNERMLVDFVKSVEATFGGDAPECYELVLRTARELNWCNDEKLEENERRQKVLIMIGDDVPHGPTYKENTLHINWREELQELTGKGVNVYGVHAMPGIRKHSKQFYEEIASLTGGFYLTLDQFANLPDIIMAICYKQGSNEQLEAYADNLKQAGKLNYNVRSAISTMLNKKVEAYANGDGLVPVSEGRFQGMMVEETCSIKEFVLSQGVTFKTGRGFYELTKREKVASYKEIILYEKETGKLFNGPQVREMLGLYPETEKKDHIKENIKPVVFDKYKVFIQSTSYNRKLMPNTMLLYEVTN